MGFTAEALVASCVALAVTTLALPIVRHLLVRLDVLDQVSARSSHRLATPRGAGLAQMPGIVMGLASVAALTWAALVAVAGFTLLGAWDDWNSRSPRIRLVAQLLVTCFVVGVLALVDLPNVGAKTSFVIFGACMFMLIINTVNFMDGANGMSATHGILFGFAYAILTWQVDAPAWAILGLCLSAASAAFMPWNFKKTALLFLGDSGSYLLGAIVALLVLVCWAQGTSLLIALAPLAIYLSDVGLTLLRRAIAGKPIFQAHREHAYQALPVNGWDHRKTSLLVLIFSGACCVSSLIAQAGIISLPLLGMLITLVVVTYFVTIHKFSNI